MNPSSLPNLTDRAPDSALDRVRIVLVETSHPGNIGAAARAMKTMGLSRLYLVAPRTLDDAESRGEAMARASGAVDVLDAAVVCATLDEALAGCAHAAAITARRRDLAASEADSRRAAGMLLDAAAAGDVALVFGNETSGLSNEQAARCPLYVRIPANPDYGSLNLGAAVQVLCYELRMAALAGGAAGEVGAAGEGVESGERVATLDEVEGMIGHFERVMAGTRFLDPRQPRRLVPKLRRMFARIRPEKDEVNILRGLLAACEARVAKAPPEKT